MLTIHVRDKNGELWDPLADGIPVTFSVDRPGTFDPLPPGLLDAGSFRRNPTKKELEVLKHVCGHSGTVDKGKELECSRALVLAIFMKAPWIRRQVEEAIAKLKQPGAE